MPATMQRLLAKVEARRCEIQEQAVWEGLKFWSLKVPAILAACGSGITAFFNSEIGLSLGILTSLLLICVALDRVIRPGRGRNVLLAAADGLENLKNSIELWWDELKDRSPDDAATQIMAKAEREWKKIADCLD